MKTFNVIHHRMHNQFLHTLLMSEPVDGYVNGYNDTGKVHVKGIEYQKKIQMNVNVNHLNVSMRVNVKGTEHQTNKQNAPTIQRHRIESESIGSADRIRS
eukprot:984535_1